jgi:hypothetical protein
MLQKKTIRIISGIQPTNSHRGLFKRLGIISLPLKYICSLMNFTVNNQEHCQTDSVVHSVNTRNKLCLPRPIASLSMLSEKYVYAGIRIFNTLPSSLKSLYE